MDIERQLEDLEKEIDENESKEIEMKENFNVNDYRLNSVEAQIISKQIDRFGEDIKNICCRMQGIEETIVTIDKKIVSPIETLQEQYHAMHTLKIEIADKIEHMQKDIEELKNTRFRQFLKKYGAHAITAGIGSATTLIVVALWNWLKDKFQSGTP